MSRNIPFMVGDKRDMWNKIMLKVKLGRLAGPYLKIPFEHFVQSPIGLVEKSGNKTRLIFHLSFDFTLSQNISCACCTGEGLPDDSRHKSVNFWIPKEKCSVKYRDLDHVVRNCLCFEPGIIYYSKTDLVSAFRVLPILSQHRYLLISKAEDPGTGLTYYFVEKCLSFGTSISCSHFQKFSNALRHILQVKTGLHYHCSNYLDDFLFYHVRRTVCNHLVSTFHSICDIIGVPWSIEKTEWASAVMVFLGILLNGNYHVLCVPEEKRLRVLSLLESFINKDKATIKQMQSLAGLLNFICKAVTPGRTFTRRMYLKFTGGTIIKRDGTKLKDHHHVRIDGEFKNDCRVWQLFLNTPLSVSRPFIDYSETRIATKLNYNSDASANPNLGFGVIFGKEWVASSWNKEFVLRNKPSIEYLELYASCVGIYTWGHQLTDTRVVLFCDNRSVCDMLNNDCVSKCKNCMYLLRLITLKNLLQNRRIFADHVKGKWNIQSDALSHGQWKRFYHHSPTDVSKHSLPLPKELWPMEKIWQKS